MPVTNKYKTLLPNDDTAVDDNGCEVPWYDDDYEYWKSENERWNDPLDDDYNKYDHE
jgi:hypothetical protein